MTAHLSALLTGDGSYTLYNALLDETYHSRNGALQESNYVFIAQGLRYFWSQKKATDKARILEIGFGTGLNAYLTLQESESKALYYTGIEPYPPDAATTALLQYENLLPNPALFREIHTAAWNKIVTISPIHTLLKIKNTLQDAELSANNFDIIYFDAFAPAKQPEMWTIQALAKAALALKSGGILVTYCAQGQFKRNLRAQGMEVFTLPGPPGKREMVRATKQ